MVDGVWLDGFMVTNDILNLDPESCTFLIIPYLCRPHECTGFVASVSKHSPPFSVGGQALFFPTSENLSQKPAGQLYAVCCRVCVHPSFLLAIKSPGHIERC